MTPRLTTDCVKNYCNQTLIVQVIVENVVTFFYGTRCMVKFNCIKKADRWSAKPTTHNQKIKQNKQMRSQIGPSQVLRKTVVA